jgi:hypothetical protein
MNTALSEWQEARKDYVAVNRVDNILTNHLDGPASGARCWNSVFWNDTIIRQPDEYYKGEIQCGING